MDRLAADPAAFEAEWAALVDPLNRPGDPLDVLCDECGHTRQDHNFGTVCDGDDCTCRREPTRITRPGNPEGGGDRG